MKIFNLAMLGFFFFTAVSYAAECTEQFSWLPNSEEGLAGYKIYYGLDAGGPYSSVVDIGKPAPVNNRIRGEVSGLICGEHYYFVCRAYNAAGLESDNSTQIDAVIIEPITAIFGSVAGGNYDGTIQDTFIKMKEENNIANQQLNTYTWPENMVANAIIMKIDLAQLPKGVQVQSASLYLYASEAGGDSVYDISAHKIINHNPVLSATTGSTYDGTNGWTANTSTNNNNFPLAQSDIGPKAAESSIDASDGYKSWDVTAVVTDWLAEPSLNYGLLLNSDTAASIDSYRFFASSEAADANQRPKLVIKYTVGDMPAPIITNMSQN